MVIHVCMMHVQECIKEMLVKKSLGMVKIPLPGKFLGLVVIAAPSATSQSHMSPKLYGYILPLPRSQQVSQGQQSQAVST